MASSCCRQVLKFWPQAPEHHRLRLVIDSALEQLDRLKDAGWLYLQLSLGLYRKLQGGGPQALEALARASVRLEQAIQELRVPFDLKLKQVLELLRSVAQSWFSGALSSRSSVSRTIRRAEKS